MIPDSGHVSPNSIASNNSLSVDVALSNAFCRKLARGRPLTSCHILWRCTPRPSGYALGAGRLHVLRYHVGIPMTSGILSPICTLAVMRPPPTALQALLWPYKSFHSFAVFILPLDKITTRSQAILGFEKWNEDQASRFQRQLFPLFPCEGTFVLTQVYQTPKRNWIQLIQAHWPHHRSHQLFFISPKRSWLWTLLTIVGHPEWSLPNLSSWKTDGYILYGLGYI